MNRIVPISDLQTQAKRCVDYVNKTKSPVVITQRGRAAAVLVAYENYEGHMATLDEMQYPDWKERLKKAEKESGKGVQLETYLKERKKA